MRLTLATLIWIVPVLTLADEPKRETVTPRPFRVELTVDGVFESANMTEVKLQPEEWATFQVVKAAPHGATVKAGDVLIEFETKQIDKELRDLDFQLKLGALGLQLANVELAALEKTTPLDLTAAERFHKQAIEDWEYFEKEEEGLTKEQIAERQKQMQDYLMMEKEELDQLEKMYKADELTEETEEIILKRQRRAVESALFTVRLTDITNKRELEVQMPRQKTVRKEALEREGLGFERAKVSLPSALEQKRIEVQKLVETQKQLEEKAANIRKDRDLLTVKAPVAGVVYYGACDRGRWSSIDTVRALLKPSAAATAQTTLMTIVAAGDLFVRVDIAEKDVRYVKTGKDARVVATAYPDDSVAATVTTVDQVPFKDGAFNAYVKPVPGPQSVLAGMTGKVTLVAVEEAAAITIPTTAIFTKDGQADAKYVYIPGAEGQPATKQDITPGLASGDRTQIVKGLKAGDIVLLSKPE